tara:strand:- start:239 stop:568 length:330 start_codon:yes stop_codon:yes gene_type:complete
MNIDKALAKLLKEKESLVDSIELCCKSIEFWEKKAEKVFKKMDDFESESIFQSDEASETKYVALMKDSNRLMSRINFENSQLDKLEALILDLEERIINTLDKYAKKQKK